MSTVDDQKPGTWPAGGAGSGDVDSAEEATAESAAPDPATESHSEPASSNGATGSALVFDDPLDRPSSDDTDRGWGDSSSAGDDDFTRFLNEKPPHHL